MRRRALSLVLCVFLAGCVTERINEDGTTTRVRKPAATSEVGGPVASPAFDARTLNTHVKIALTPLGTVRYDGQVLPLVSPDGRFVAVQQGGAPTWPTLLAQPDASIPLSASIAVYDITGETPRRIEIAEPLPPGLILARGVDARGFLVEAPQPDGSRWIGRVTWVGGRFDWLVRTNEVNAHATLAPDGGLIYARRAIRDPMFTIVVGGVPLDAHGASLEYPLATDDDDLIYALERSEIGLAVVAIRREAGSSAVVARRRLSSSVDPLIAYQSAAAAFTAPAPTGGARRLTVFLPRAQRLAVFDAVEASLAPLPDKSIAGAFSPVEGLEGYFCTTPDGLVFTPRPDPADLWEVKPGAEPAPMAKVLADPFVPRATTDPERPLILLGPDPAAPDRLRLFALKPIS